jgi:hypothetical protein
VYGEGESANSLFQLLKAAMAAGDREFPMSSGEQLRDYSLVNEVARRLAGFVMNPSDPGPIKIRSGQTISARCVVEIWIEENGVSSRVMESCRIPTTNWWHLGLWLIRPRVLRFARDHG